jgi:poly-gamma-glutamate capsule biosynthesis protein CapA/YwtB (metallophosphatase superfamily)
MSRVSSWDKIWTTCSKLISFTAIVTTTLAYTLAPLSQADVGQDSAAPPDEATAQPIPAAPVLAQDEIVLVFAGDTGLTGNHSGYAGWEATTSGIAPLINGDLNFANLETVVTDRNDLLPEPKLFNFRTHPDGVRHLLRTGFNLFSAANNHSMDYGVDGARETVTNLDAMLAEGLIAHAGLGLNRDEAAATRAFDVKGQRIAFAAIGIASQGVADADTPGQLAYQYDRDFDDVLGGLAGTPANYRILSVHHGNEFDVKTPRQARYRLRNRALRTAGIDLVVGHHQHVVAGVEMTGGRLIFYGLGNFLHLGTQDMTVFDMCRDYGLVARVHLAGLNGRFTVRAIEAIPIQRMHARPAPIEPEASRARIHVLNHLAEALDDPAAGSWGVRFAPQSDGRGIYCAPDAHEDRSNAGTLCSTAEPFEPPPETLRRKIASACAATVTRSYVGLSEPAPQTVD